MRRRPAVVLLAATALVAGLLAPNADAASAESPAMTGHSSSVPLVGVRSPHAVARSATEVRLSWHPTRTALYAGTTIRRTVGIIAAASTADGTPVARTARAATHLVQRGLRPGTTYTYAFFARDVLDRYAAATSTTVRTPRVPSAPRRIAPGTRRPTVVSPAAAGTISGTVTTAAGGAGVESVYVTVYDADGEYLTNTFTDADGRYQVAAAATSVGDVVCFDASSASVAPTGYVDQCYQDVPWTGFDLPAGTTPVPVAAGMTSGGIDAVLDTGGAVSGRVTASSGGAGLESVSVVVLDGSGNYYGQGATATDGRYRITGLVPNASGHTVCFDATDATGGSSAAGYRSQCFRGKTWNGDTSDLPAGTTPVTVSAGATHVNVNAALTASGAIGGTVLADGGAPLADVAVQLYQANGAYLTGGSTAADGTYRITGLAASSTGYDVCFDAGNASGGSSQGGYRSECYDNVPDDDGSLPGGLTRVPVSNGVISTVNASLSAGGAISGKVSSAATANGIGQVAVRVLGADGNDVGDGYTRTNGTYVVAGLPASSGYTVCFDPTSGTGGGSRTGYVKECFDDVPWNGYDVPAGVTPVPTDVGAVTSDISAQLTVAGAISGKVVAAAGGVPLGGVDVSVVAPDGSYVGDALTGGTGTYRIAGLAALTPGYAVCFDASQTTSGPNSYGYLSQCWQNKPWTPGNDVPAGATPVSVAGGATHGNINARLAAAGAITGAVTASGAGVGSVEVSVWTSTGNYLTGTETEGDGSYEVSGLAAGTSYRVCFDARFAGGPPTGDASQCYQGVAWSGLTTPPAASSAVAVTAGAATPGIDAALTTAGAVAGTVYPPPALAAAAPSPSGPSPVSVQVYDSAQQLIGYGGATIGAAYELDGLTPSAAGYTVCFALSHQDGQQPYASQCYEDIDWNGLGAGNVPSSATPVPVTAGVVSGGVDAHLKVGGAITGRVGSDSGPVTGVLVDVFDSAGAIVEQVFPGRSGNYRAAGLLAGTGYRVCFDPQSGGGPDSLVPQCFRNKAWAGGGTPPPSNATPVAVTLGQTTTGINVTLRHPAT